MNRPLLLVVTVCITATLLQAQPNLRVQTLPAPFLSFTMKVCDTTGVRPGPSGTGQVWNFNSLQQRNQDTTQTIYTDKSSLTPEQQEKLRNAEVIVIDDTTTSGFRIADGQWRWEGSFTPNASVVAGSDPYDVRPSEVVFNDPKNDQYDALFESTFLPPGQYQRTGTHTYLYDGFGQLILPDFVYSNVARITQIDSTSTEFSIGPQQAFLTITTNITMWQQVNSNIPLMLIESVSGQVLNREGIPLGPSFNSRTVRYRAVNATTSVDEETENSLTVSPSPTSNDHVVINDVTIDPSRIIVITSDGAMVSAPATRTSTGVTVDIRALAPGAYTILILEGASNLPRFRAAQFIRLR